MEIIMSAHMDLARPVMSIKMDANNLEGLVDNFAGVFVAYQASRKTGIPVHFTNFEELDYDGAEAVANSVSKDALVIVVDTILERDTNGKNATIANVYGMENYLGELKSRFENNIHFIDGLFEETEDETWIYGHKYNLKTFYYGVPIPGNYYHSTELKVPLASIDSISKVLVEVIEYFKKNNR
jgi:putative aminopeptidase FrvX